jgi:hypothetical protein
VGIEAKQPGPQQAIEQAVPFVQVFVALAAARSNGNL